MIKGIPEEDYDRKVMVPGRAFHVTHTGEDRQEVNEAVKLFRGYICGLLQDRRAALRENLLLRLLITADGIA